MHALDVVVADGSVQNVRDPEVRSYIAALGEFRVTLLTELYVPCLCGSHDGPVTGKGIIGATVRAKHPKQLGTSEHACVLVDLPEALDCVLECAQNADDLLLLRR